MKKLFRIKAHEAKHGPHFDEEMARKATMHMQNEDGSNGPHWSEEEAATLANQYGVKFGRDFNKYDWYVALNMIYSDFYKAITSLTNSNNPKHFVEFAKCWLEDKDVEEGKMWHYYLFIMDPDIKETLKELCEMYGEDEMDEYGYDDYEDEHMARGRGGRGRNRRGRRSGRRSEYSREMMHPRHMDRMDHMEHMDRMGHMAYSDMDMYGDEGMHHKRMGRMAHTGSMDSMQDGGHYAMESGRHAGRSHMRQTEYMPERYDHMRGYDHEPMMEHHRRGRYI